LHFAPLTRVAPALAALLAITGACGGDRSDSVLEEPPAASAPRSHLTEAERALYRDAAHHAWQYIERYYQPTTGFVNATPEWTYTTIWDIGGQLLAFVAAVELGLVDSVTYHSRLSRALTTLERVPLFRDAAFNKLYSTVDGSMGSATQRGGTGWSATDLGRLLVALKVVAEREPIFAAQADRIVQRIRFDQVVRGGYLHGQMIGRSGRPWTFQEGRIGYEQYVARGFELWGANVSNALDFMRHAEPVQVYGVTLVRDRRWQDRLVSEPFVLLGLELGYTPELERLAWSVLAAQEARYRATGQITIASEDAIALPPHYFYYYCVYCNRQAFVIDAAEPGRPLNIRPWVSTKAAFGWRALFPTEYTSRSLEHVQSARTERGWASGVFEGTGELTGTYDVNTAAVILEAAAFQLRGGRPLIEPQDPPPLAARRPEASQARTPPDPGFRIDLRASAAVAIDRLRQASTAASE
jgi:hypothetical protein